MYKAIKSGILLYREMFMRRANTKYEVGAKRRIPKFKVTSGPAPRFVHEERSMQRLADT